MKDNMPRRCGWILLIAWMLGVVGCRSTAKSTVEPGVSENRAGSLTVTSSAFQDGETIPKKYTCDGENISPDIHWTGLPSGTKSVTLIADDPDAPAGTWVHWVIIDIPADSAELPESAGKTGQAGTGVEGLNSSGVMGYSGPCPPKGNPHRYYFKVYALDTALELKPGVKKADVEDAMRSHILAQGQLMGKYGR